MKYTDIQEKLREKRDVIIVVLIIVAILFSIIIGMRMQKGYSARKHAEEQSRNPEKVQLNSSDQTIAGSENVERKPSASFFLKPSPDEVLSLIKEVGAGKLPPANQEYTGLRVMWPAYFFQVLQQQSNRATLLLDVSEDGFGVTIETEIDTTRFPAILSTEPGTKLWIAGEILGVDATGTGTIHMLAEEVRFQDNLMEAIRGEATTPGQVQPANPSDGSMTVKEEKP